MAVRADRQYGQLRVASGRRIWAPLRRDKRARLRHGGGGGGRGEERGWLFAVEYFRVLPSAAGEVPEEPGDERDEGEPPDDATRDGASIRL